MEPRDHPECKGMLQGGGVGHPAELNGVRRRGPRTADLWARAQRGAAGLPRRTRLALAPRHAPGRGGYGSSPFPIHSPCPSGGRVLQNPPTPRSRGGWSVPASLRAPGSPLAPLPRGGVGGPPSLREVEWDTAFDLSVAAQCRLPRAVIFWPRLRAMVEGQKIAEKAASLLSWCVCG